MRITSLEAYISWFPKSGDDGLIVTGREIESSQKQALALKLKSEDEDINMIKGRILSFLGKEYKAQGSDYATDVSQYGIPAIDRTLSITKLDFVNVIESVFKMMSYRILPQNIIIMEDVLPDATY